MTGPSLSNCLHDPSPAERAQHAAELQAVRELAPKVRFDDGRVTNPDSTVKHNLQAPQDDDANARIAQIARGALVRNPDLRTYAHPRSMARTTVVRYEPGMDYGWHVDEALFRRRRRFAATCRARSFSIRRRTTTAAS